MTDRHIPSVPGSDSPAASTEVRQQHYLEKELHDLLSQDTLMFEFLQEGSVDGMWYWDLTQPEEEWMSAKFWQVFGYDPLQKAHKAAEWQDIIFPEDLELAKRNLSLHLSDPSYPYDQIVRYRHSDGDTVWVRCRGVAIHDADGNPVRMLGAHTDISTVMRQQQELLTLRSKYDACQRRLTQLKSANQILEAQTANAMTEVANAAWCDQFGFPSEASLLLQARLLCATARQLDVPIHSLRVDAQVPHVKETKLPYPDIVELKSIVFRCMTETVPNAIPVCFSTQLFGMLCVGYSNEKLADLTNNLHDALSAQKWLAIQPTFSLSYRCTAVDSEALNGELTLETILTLLF